MADTTNYGLLTNMAQGIREGMIQYQTAKNANRQNQLLMLAQGIQQGDDGNYQFTPEMQQQREAKAGILQGQLATTKHQQALMDPSTPESQSVRESIKGLLPEKNRGSISDKLSGTEAEKLAGLFGTGLKNDQMMNALLARQGYQEKRLAYQSDKEARSSANNDPMLKQYLPRLEGAAKIGELINSARQGKVVNNQALLGQLNAEISRLETGSQSPGLHASEKTELLDRKAQLQALADSFTGKPTDAVRPEVLDAAEKLVQELSGSYMSGIDARMDYLKGGASDTQQHIFDEKHQSIKKTYGPRFGRWGEEKYGDRQAQGLVAPQPQAKQEGGGILGMLGLGKAQAAPGQAAQDPDAAKYAQMHNLPYDQAKAIIDARRSGR